MKNRDHLERQKTKTFHLSASRRDAEGKVQGKARTRKIKREVKEKVMNKMFRDVFASDDSSNGSVRARLCFFRLQFISADNEHRSGIQIHLRKESYHTAN